MKNINIREKIAVDKGQWMVKHPETNINQVMGLNESLSEIKTKKVDKTDIGNLSNLQTTSKDNLVSAINEVDQSKLNKDGDTATGIIKAHNNTKYGVGQIRNIIISKNTPNISQMKNGDIWLKYE